MDIQHLTIEVVKQIKGDLLDKINHLEQRIMELESKNNLHKGTGGSIIQQESPSENKHVVEEEHSSETELIVQNNETDLGGIITW